MILWPILISLLKTIKVLLFFLAFIYAQPVLFLILFGLKVDDV